MKIDHYPFEGWDFMELAHAWNIPVIHGSAGDITDADDIVFYIRSLYKTFDGGDMTRPMRKCAKDIRIFVGMLGDCDDNNSALWKGLASIEDDYSIIRLSIPLIGYMWD